MGKSYHLENIERSHQENPRTFLKPSEDELDKLTVGGMVRLFFVFDSNSEDGCRAERMWVKISEIEGKNFFKGYLTNQPVYIKDLNIGDVIRFERNNIATVLVEAMFEEKKIAVITQRAFEKQEINWLIRSEPGNDDDSGWQLFYGDEDEKYINDPDNSMVVTLEQILSFEPKLEKCFVSTYTAFEWDDEKNDFVVIKDF